MGLDKLSGRLVRGAIAAFTALSLSVGVLPGVASATSGDLVIPTINIGTGKDAATGAESGTGWVFENEVLTISASGSYRITGGTGGTIASNSNRVVVANGAVAEVTLDKVSIDSGEAHAIELRDNAKVTLHLDGDNWLQYRMINPPYPSAIRVPTGTSLTIGGTGYLYNHGYNDPAGLITPVIGADSAGDITINGGSVIATGGYIGSAVGSDGSGNITINGGSVAMRPDRPDRPVLNSGTGGSTTINGGTIFLYAQSIAGRPKTGDDIGGGPIVINGGSFDLSQNGGLSPRFQTQPVNGSGQRVWLNHFILDGYSSLPFGERPPVTRIDVKGDGVDSDVDYVYDPEDAHTDDAGNVYLYLPANPAVRTVSIVAGGYLYQKDFSRPADDSNVQTFTVRPWLTGSLTVTGESVIDRLLTATAAGLAPDPPVGGDSGGLSYVWKRDGEVIPGANSTTYRLTGDDVGVQITAVVTAANWAGELESAPIGPVNAVITVAPSVNGTVAPSVSTATPGSVVELSVQPDQSFLLDTISVSKTGEPTVTVAVTKQSATLYTFVMPSWSVTVEPAFVSVDVIAVATAKDLIESKLNLTVPANISTEAAVKVWLAGQINAIDGMAETGVTVTPDQIVLTSFTAATDGSNQNPNGVDGSFTFTVKLTKGSVSNVTDGRSGVMTAQAAYRVMVAAGPNGSVALTGGYYLPGTKVTITATAAPGYRFNAWTVTGVTTNTATNPAIFTMPAGPVALTASFVKDTAGPDTPTQGTSPTRTTTPTQSTSPTTTTSTITPVAPNSSQVVKVKAAQTRLALVKGKTFKLAAAAYIADGTKVKVAYKSSKPKIARVSQTGKIKALKPGKTKITVTSTNGRRTVIKVTVVAKKTTGKIKKITVKGVAKTQTVGRVSWARVTWKPIRKTGAAVKYASTNKTILSVDKTGRVQARAVGSAVLKIKISGETKRIRVTIR